MTLTFKTLAITGLISCLSIPAIASTTLNVSTMTCEEYNGLNGVNRDRVAMAAILELNDNVQPTDGTATATDSSVGTAAEESNSAASSGSATATSIAPADDDMTRYSEEIGVLNRTCSRNWDATVMEAAIGSSGTR